MFCLTRLSLRLLIASFLLVTSAAADAAETLPLQKMVDEAKRGDIVAPPPGIYKGPVFIDKPITLDGRGKVTIDSGGVESVIVLETDGATVKNLTLRNSGDQHNSIDSGVQVRGNYNVVKDNIIEDCLFGVDLQQSNNNVVRRNRISSKPFHMGVRGDAIRMWYSTHNKITENEIFNSRDMVVWYSANNEIRGNQVRDGRYGLHFMYSKYNLVEENSYSGNTVGIFLMYSDDVVLRKNKITRAIGAAGMGIGMKESSNVEITDNEILYSSIGIYLDVSPFQPDTTNRIYRNTIAFASEGVKFLNDWTGNILQDNRFENNIHQVSVAALASAKRNEWTGNYWDDYEGFDRNNDQIGDSPYEKRVYADRIWMDVPHAAFYKGSPVLTMIDFMERLAPFTEPITLLKDAKPKIQVKFGAAKNDEFKEEKGMGAGDRIDPFGIGKQ